MPSTLFILGRLGVGRSIRETRRELKIQQGHLARLHESREKGYRRKERVQYDFCDESYLREAGKEKYYREEIETYINTIRYLKAILRQLRLIRFIDYLVRALHRIFYIPHRFLSNSQSADDGYINTFSYRFSRVKTGMCCYLPIAS